MTQIRTISPARPKEIVMDWDRLRAEGLQHLEQLATGIWTDFNAHDPGITILEVLCYAITDLGYRTNFDIKDLIAPPNGNGTNEGKHFFTPLEVLPCHPATPNDFRRVLIDMPGVKNAWLRKADEKLVWEGLEIKIGDKEKQALADRLKSTVDDVDATISAIQGNTSVGFSKIAHELICKHSRCKLKFEPENKTASTQLHLNGLYHILLDLDDEIDTNNVLLVRRLKAAVLDKLHQYRSLCEDYARVEVVKQRPIALCLEVELHPDTDANQVEAEILHKIENYLTPEVRFYSLDQLLEEGLSCDTIYNGLVLENGFIKESELEASELRRVIYKSDLYHEILDISGVASVSNLKLGDCINDCPDWKADAWCFEVYKEDESPAKAVLNSCCTRIFLTINGIDVATDTQEIEENLAILKMQNAQLRGDDAKEKLPTPGNYYDWSEYTSIQHDFPATYHVGDWALPDSAPALRHAQVKQLKGFLLFFDQILANYLTQLAQVRDVLSVMQNPNDPTLFFQAISGVEGLGELLSNESNFLLNARASRKMKRILRDVLKEERIDNDTYLQIHHHLQSLMDSAFDNQKAFLQSLGTDLELGKELEDALFSALEPSSEYLQALAAMTEPRPKQQLRKNLLLDHLLARFGERFTDYALGLYATMLQQDETTTKDFGAYLQDKSDFLEVIPALHSERGQGYDIKKISPKTLLPDVWDTQNVSGLEKRVSRLLGIPNFQRKSLICKSAFKIEIQESYGTNDRLQYELLFLDEKDRVLLKSPKPLRIKLEEMHKQREQLYAAALNEDNYTIDEASAKSEKLVLRIKYGLPGKETFVQSAPVENAEALKKRILKLALPGDCNVEGFHLIEHILLRPNDKNDEILSVLPPCNDAEGCDPYSFWITVLLPNWVSRFKNSHFQRQFEQTFRLETPAHIAVRFCWIDNEKMIAFEGHYKKWLAEKAKCTPDECNVNEFANGMIKFLNTLECTCFCCTEDVSQVSRCG